MDLSEPDPNQQTMITLPVERADLIGRLRSQLFFLIDGYIYFNDCVIKVRLDLLRDSTDNNDYGEEIVFDFYFDILPVEDDYRVLSKMPLYDVLSKRLFFTMTNTRRMLTKKIVMLPFLHERQILLRHLDPQF